MNRVLLIFIILCSQACTHGDSDEAKVPNVIPTTDDMICERVPTAYVVGETISGPKSKCQASAKILAIAYECGEASNTLHFTTESLKVNITKAKEKCDDFCADIDSSCEGVLNVPYTCGLVSPQTISLDVGKNVIHCPKHCKGQAFNYCSIYQGDFFSTDRSLFTAMKENCNCRKK